MNQKNSKPQYNDPWEQEMYQTGSTKPPKSHGGTAVLLVGVVFLTGIASIFGMWKLQSLHNPSDTPGNGLTIQVGSSSSNTVEEFNDPAPSVPRQEVSLQLSKSPASVENCPQEGGLSLQEIYVNNIDSVVSISCQTKAGQTGGTGVVVAENGYIVTNCHVVEDARTIVVQLTDNRAFRASIVGTDPTSDLAVLYVQAKDLKPAVFGDSDALRVGDAVCAIGDPLGAELRGTMTDGIVSAINRDITAGGRSMTLIQTNAALNPGNSGGPLINCYGQVIGINTMKIGDLASDSGVEGLGFAIPSTTVVEIAEQLIATGYVSGRPHLAFTGEEVSLMYQKYYRLPKGLFITQIAPGSDAERQGLEVGDILISLDGNSVTTPEIISSLLYGYEVGDTMDAVIYRNGKHYTITLTVEEAKE